MIADGDDDRTQRADASAFRALRLSFVNIGVVAMLVTLGAVLTGCPLGCSAGGGASTELAP